MDKKQRIGIYLLTFFAIVAVIGLFISPAIKQDELYHNFSDSNTILGIPNFWNVISNLPYVLFGLIGLRNKQTLQYIIFFISISFVGFGSAYYHLNPNSDTLVWDRLPMTLAFMSLISIIISEFINDDLGKKTIIPLLIVGVSSVIYWVLCNDLKFYALIQFYPMIAIPIILIVFKNRHSLTYGYWILLICYLIAKICEHFDYEIHNTISLISGHTIKHIVSALGIFILDLTYKRRVVTN